MPGVAPILEAALHGRVADVVALIADGADVNETLPEGGETALHIACHQNHTEVVAVLQRDERAPVRRFAFLVVLLETTKSRRTPRDEETRSQPSRRICALGFALRTTLRCQLQVTPTPVKNLGSAARSQPRSLKPID